MLRPFVNKIRSQHRQDLWVYQTAHQEWRNILIHCIMIPVECFSFQLFIRAFGGSLVNAMVAMTLAVLSMTVAIRPTVGVASFVFHTTAGWLANLLVTTRYDLKTVICISMSCWTVAWAVQVGIGHYLLEKNAPNVANMKEVSYLAMGLSVLIAWSSFNQTCFYE